MIVIVTRSDLCNESLMTDEAFALSPIAARPVMPGDADYDAIRDAFMETSRGRWFLSEFAKRNRNADTAMVLDAVAKIEQNLAAQKEANAHGLAESLVAIRAIVGEAKASVGKAVAGLEDETTLRAGFAGARNIREVAATLRDCGADIRICDLLDSQIAAVESGYRLIIAIDPDEIVASFDLMLERITELTGTETADSGGPAQPAQAPAESAGERSEAADAAPMAAAPSEPETAALDEAATAGLVIVRAMPGDEVEFVEPAEAAIEAADVVAEVALPETVLDDELQPAATDIEMRAADTVVEQAMDEAVASDTEMAEDDAILDLVAREMSAMDFSADAEEESQLTAAVSFEADALGSERAEPVIDAPIIDEAAEAAPEISSPSMADDLAIAAVDVPADVVPADAVAVAQPAPPSLGAAVLASGAVGHPTALQSGVLTPIRRMTQAEKIAFFS